MDNQKTELKKTSAQKSASATRILLVGVILIIVVAMTSWLICQFAVGSEKLGFPAILILFTVLFMGIGLYQLSFAVFAKRALMLMFGTIFSVIGLIFLLAIFSVQWWVILLISIALLVIGAIGVYAMKAPKLAIEYDNSPESERKTYAEKKSEEAGKPKEEEKPLPEIKSFKD